MPSGAFMKAGADYLLTKGKRDIKAKKKKKELQGQGDNKQTKKKCSLKKNVVFLSFMLQISKQLAFAILLEQHPIKVYFFQHLLWHKKF